MGGPPKKDDGGLAIYRIPRPVPAGSRATRTKLSVAVKAAVVMEEDEQQEALFAADSRRQVFVLEG